MDAWPGEEPHRTGYPPQPRASFGAIRRNRGKYLQEFSRFQQCTLKKDVSRRRPSPSFIQPYKGFHGKGRHHGPLATCPARERYRPKLQPPKRHHLLLPPGFPAASRSILTNMRARACLSRSSSNQVAKISFLRFSIMS